jgi:hypothetical protein
MPTHTNIKYSNESNRVERHAVAPWANTTVCFHAKPESQEGIDSSDLWFS